jgi:hypothetical protein
MKGRFKRTTEEQKRIAELLARRRRQLNDDGWVDTGKSTIGNLSKLYASRRRKELNRGDEQ